MPITPLTRRCPLLKPDGTPCRRGIGEGIYTCRWHSRTPEGQAFNKEARQHRWRLDEANHELRQAERHALAILIAWSSKPAENDEDLREAAERLRKAKENVDAERK